MAAVRRGVAVGSTILFLLLAIGWKSVSQDTNDLPQSDGSPECSAAADVAQAQLDRLDPVRRAFLAAADSSEFGWGALEGAAEALGLQIEDARAAQRELRACLSAPSHEDPNDDSYAGVMTAHLRSEQAAVGAESGPYAAMLESFVLQKEDGSPLGQGVDSWCDLQSSGHAVVAKPRIQQIVAFGDDGSGLLGSTGLQTVGKLFDLELPTDEAISDGQHRVIWFGQDSTAKFAVGTFLDEWPLASCDDEVPDDEDARDESPPGENRWTEISNGIDEDRPAPPATALLISLLAGLFLIAVASGVRGRRRAGA